MKKCFSWVIYLASKLINLWRTRHKYACEKCCHYKQTEYSERCRYCTKMVSTRNASQLPQVGVPTNWDKK